MHMKTRTAFLAACLLFAGASISVAQVNPQHESAPSRGGSRSAQIVALDECDPATFNALLGPDFCKNVALGASTTLSDLFAKGRGRPARSGLGF